MPATLRTRSETNSTHFETEYKFMLNIFKVRYDFLKRRHIFFYMNIVHTNKYNKKLQSPGVLNIKETPGYKQKENVKKNNDNK